MKNTDLLTRVNNQLVIVVDSLPMTSEERAFVSALAVIQTKFGKADRISISGSRSINDPRPRLDIDTAHGNAVLDSTLHQYIQEWLNLLNVRIPVTVRFEADCPEEHIQTVFQHISKEYPSVSLQGGPQFAGHPYRLSFEIQKYAVFQLREDFRPLSSVSISWDEQDMGEVALRSLLQTEKGQ